MEKMSLMTSVVDKVAVYGESMKAAVTAEERWAVVKAAAEDLGPHVSLAAMMLPEKEIISEAISDVFKEMYFDLLLKQDRLFFGKGSAININPQKKEVFMADGEKAASRQVFDQMKADVAEKGVEAMVESRLESRNKVKQIVPFAVAVTDILTEAPADEEGYKANRRAYFTRVAQGMTYEEFYKEEMAQRDAISVEKVNELIDETISTTTNSQMARAMARFQAAVPMDTVADLVVDGVQVLVKGSQHFAEKGNDQNNMPESLKQEFKDYGVRLVTVWDAAKTALVAADLPLITRFDEVLEATKKNVAKQKAVVAPKKPRARRKKKAGMEKNNG